MIIYAVTLDGKTVGSLFIENEQECLDLINSGKGRFLMLRNDNWPFSQWEEVYMSINSQEEDEVIEIDEPTVNEDTVITLEF